MRDNSTTTPSSDASLDSEGAILAWLEQQVRASATGVSFDYVPFGFRFMRHHHIGEPCKSIAEAIRQDGGPASSSPSPAIVKEAGEVGHVRELLAEAYKHLSGRDLHASDCATSLAPAYTPGPCDCYPRVLFLNWPAEKIDEPVGWKGENPPTPDHFQCEFCGESNLDCTLIPHRQNCPVTSARAALSASNAAQVSK